MKASRIKKIINIEQESKKMKTKYLRKWIRQKNTTVPIYR